MHIAATRSPLTGLPRALAARPHLEFVLCGLAAVTIVFARSFVFLFYEQASFDSDQAILGLMAKHVSELRAFPLFQYGLEYLLAVETYVTAPFFWIGGASVTTLKLPLVVANCAIELLLIRLLMTTLSLRPIVATLATGPFLLPPPITSATLVEALGGNTAPLVFVLLLWICRHRPIVFGALFAVGFLTREFTAYGVAALLCIELADRSLFRWDRLREKQIALVTFGIVWHAIYLLRPLASVQGPGSGGVIDAEARAGAALNVLGFFCSAGLDRWLANLTAVSTGQLPTLFGTARVPLADANLASAGWQGMAWSSTILLAVLVAAAGRLLWLQFGTSHRSPAPSPSRSASSPSTSDARFACYLVLVGLQAAAMYAISRCDHVGILQQRYILLALFIPVGLAGFFLAREPSRTGRTLAVAALGAWMLLSARPHVALLTEYIWTPPVHARRALADALIAAGVHYGRADYWDAYTITFLTNEQVILTPDRFTRIVAYDHLVDAHEDEAVMVSREPCPDRTPSTRHGVWSVCR